MTSKRTPHPMRRRDVLVRLASAPVALWATPGAAQAPASSGALASAAGSAGAWPTQAVKLVVPFPPGGGTDVLARMLAERLRPLLNQTVVIENRPGATGNIGNDLVAKSAPDGHTVLIQGTIIGSFPHLFAKLTYDPVKDLQAVGTVAESPNVIVVQPGSPLRSVQDLLAAAKVDASKPLNYGTAGVASPQHLAMELLASMAGVKLQHITYRGTTPAVNDLLGGQTQFGAFSLSSMLPLIQGGKLRALAVLTERRTPLLPDAPSMAELGHRGVDSSIRFALFVPAATPADVVNRLAALNSQALADPALKEAFVKAGYDIVSATPAQTAAMVAREHAVWGPVVRQIGLKPE